MRMAASSLVSSPAAGAYRLNARLGYPKLPMEYRKFWLRWRNRRRGCQPNSRRELGNRKRERHYPIRHRRRYVEVRGRPGYVVVKEPPFVGYRAVYRQLVQASSVDVVKSRLRRSGTAGLPYSTAQVQVNPAPVTGNVDPYAESLIGCHRAKLVIARR